MEQQNEEVVVDTQNNEGEGDNSEETITLSKSEYEKINQTLGSLKRELKDYKKPKEDSKETSKTNSTDENRLVEKAYLRSAGITQSDEVELALETAKKWGVSIDSLVDDEDFNIKLTKLRNQRANEVATSGIKGGGGKSQAKETMEYWKAKGSVPTPEDVPDRKTRVKIVRSLMNDAKTSKTFYND